MREIIRRIRESDPTLEELSISLQQFYDCPEDLKLFGAALLQNTTLKRLNFYDNVEKINCWALQTVGLFIKSICVFLSTNKTLIFLGIKVGYLSLGNVRLLCSALMANQSVSCLDLSANKLDSEAAFQLSMLVCSNHCIKKLYVSHNNINESGLYFLINPEGGLQILDLSYNNIWLISAEARAVLCLNNTLRKLDLRGSHQCLQSIANKSLVCGVVLFGFHSHAGEDSSLSLLDWGIMLNLLELVKNPDSIPLDFKPPQPSTPVCSLFFKESGQDFIASSSASRLAVMNTSL